MIGLTNIYVDSVCRNTCARFNGVYSCDTLPLRMFHNESFVVNLSKYSEKGTHFIAIIINDHSVTYFDSYGITCTNEYILRFIRYQCKFIVYSPIRIQGDLSIHCGFFCIGCVLSFDRGDNLHAFLSKFNAIELRENDKIIIQVIKQYIR